MFILDRGKDGTFKDINGGAVPTTDLAAQKPNKKFECGIVTASSMFYAYRVTLSMLTNLLIPTCF